VCAHVRRGDHEHCRMRPQEQRMRSWTAILFRSFSRMDALSPPRSLSYSPHTFLLGPLRVVTAAMFPHPASCFLPAGLKNDLVFSVPNPKGKTLLDHILPCTLHSCASFNAARDTHLPSVALWLHRSPPRAPLFLHLTNKCRAQPDTNASVTFRFN